ncbi:MAG: hypothetical protein ABJO36_13060 [Litorimonas sp.]
MSQVYKAGEIYSFKTSPYYNYGTQDTQRYACLKILAPENTAIQFYDSMVTYVVLESVFPAPPTLDEVRGLGALVQKRFMFGQLTAFQRMSKNPPKNFATCSARSDWEPDLLEFALVGSLPLTDEEKELGERNASYSAWRFASVNAEGEWRWEHDKEMLLSEHTLQKEENERRKQTEKVRFENRLSKLTWDKLLAEDWFERWKESPPFPPQLFKDELRQRIHLSISELQSLGEKYPRAKVRKILKLLVDDITALDQKFDFVIETEEREDIYNVFDDITFLSKQRVLMAEIPDWHDLKW